MRRRGGRPSAICERWGRPQPARWLPRSPTIAIPPPHPLLAGVGSPTMGRSVSRLNPRIQHVWRGTASSSSFTVWTGRQPAAILLMMKVGTEPLSGWIDQPGTAALVPTTPAGAAPTTRLPSCWRGTTPSPGDLAPSAPPNGPHRPSRTSCRNRPPPSLGERANPSGPGG
jgi:hypothetical protein